MAENYQCSAETYCLHLHVYTLKMEAKSSSETLISTKIYGITVKKTVTLTVTAMKILNFKALL
jgi:hypothetical protein